MLITISRQFSAGAGTVAELVTRSLGWKVVDSLFVERVAERAGYSPEEVAALEERPMSFLERMAQSTGAAFPEYFSPAVDLGQFPEEKLVKITRHLVDELAAEGRMLLIGRAAAAVLSHTPETFHVRLVASEDFRVRRTSEREGLDEAKARELLHRTDRNRKRYHREFYDRDSEDSTHYHLVLNTERMGMEAAAAVIAFHARQLGWGPDPVV